VIFWSVLVVAMALGWDSLAAGLGLGTVASARRRALKLAVVFGVADGLASLIGMACGHALSPVLRSWADILGPTVVAATGLVVLWFPDLAQRAFSSDRWVWMGVPIAFTLDNLNVGLGRGIDHMPALLEPLVIGIVSGLMAWLGIGLAARLNRLVPEFAARAAGVMLLAIAVHEYVT